ncbi:MAG: hypothetical protein GXX91_08960 [Verrucomicrobiaceae bacterium]|nr:hypothetical protein [Verrucomicrobiaceae bacterium]
MLFRILPLGIVLFWLGSVGWLCAVVWAPPGSRMARVDPLEVYRVFFSWNDSINMTLLEHGLRRGQVTVSGGSGNDPVTGAFARDLSVSGSVERYDPRSVSHLVDLFWKGTVSFTEAMALLESDFSVRVPGQDLSARLHYLESAGMVDLRVSKDGREILGFDGLASGPGGSAAQSPLAMLGAMAGGPDGLGVIGALGLGALPPGALSLEASARMGNFNFGGRDMRAYLLTLRHSTHDQELRVYLSEVGEPLKIESDLGFEAVSELLVPLDAYRRDLPPKIE